MINLHFCTFEAFHHRRFAQVLNNLSPKGKALNESVQLNLEMKTEQKEIDQSAVLRLCSLSPSITDSLQPFVQLFSARLAIEPVQRKGIIISLTCSSGSSRRRRRCMRSRIQGTVYCLVGSKSRMCKLQHFETRSLILKVLL